ncbi:hypothetical protein FG386_000796 [Cryptosporidium ryanae]|uniref:uncharacterized protein n=1 Tax=Cryptosporidium ryanae TaxID=515981 RepID=UPI00351A5AED|nr:hypothetical protein FG386_000796 [Cryptosporidium ryanae]
MNKNKLFFLILSVIFNFYDNLEIPVYGDISELGYYYIRVFVGHPITQVQTLLIDTGSSLTSFSCSDCVECGIHEHGTFNISLSHSQVLECNINFSRNVKNNSIIERCNCSEEGKCIYNVEYSEGSRLSGYFIEDFVEFESTSSINRWGRVRKRDKNRLVIGCNLFEQKLFKYQKATGIMGLGNFKKVDYLNSVVQNIFKNRSLERNGAKEVISIQLNKKGGKLVFGYNVNNGFNDDLFELKSIQKCCDEERYCGYINSIKINGYRITKNKSPKNNLFKGIFDTGTTVTVLPSIIYNNLINQILNSVIKMYPYISGYDYMDGTTCWKISNKISIDVFPNLELEFIKNIKEDKFEYSTVIWTSNSYLFINEIVDSESKIYCLGIVSDYRKEYSTYNDYHNTKNHQNEIILGATFFVDREITLFLNEERIMIGGIDIDTSDISKKHLLRSYLNTEKKNTKVSISSLNLQKVQQINAEEYNSKNKQILKSLENKSRNTSNFLIVILLFNPILLIFIKRMVSERKTNSIK